MLSLIHVNCIHVNPEFSITIIKLCVFSLGEGEGKHVWTSKGLELPSEGV